MKAGRKQAGAVALEFLMLFPFVVAMLYGAAVYGLTFFAQYRMQDAAVSYTHLTLPTICSV